MKVSELDPALDYFRAEVAFADEIVDADKYADEALERLKTISDEDLEKISNGLVVVANGVRALLDVLQAEALLRMLTGVPK